ncbi:hypothetical protein Zmor_013483 [Zophobas morio]|uniref:Uncharacterized protein n=1 Tax=Zophobas morio TaxID=2755281 RepID=A0AA38ID63_9CUCU|nr:hypothetical protein Zmor_013483 [Zophobas morio]
MQHCPRKPITDTYIMKRPRGNFANMTAHKVTGCPSTPVIGLRSPPSIFNPQGNAAPPVEGLHPRTLYNSRKPVSKFICNSFANARSRCIFLRPIKSETVKLATKSRYLVFFRIGCLSARSSRKSRSLEKREVINCVVQV